MRIRGAPAAKLLLTNIIPHTGLQTHYERRTFAYQRLSELLTHQADLFASIVNTTRNYPLFFRVGFRGAGFPTAVRGREYVYRGMEGESYRSVDGYLA